MNYELRIKKNIFSLRLLFLLSIILNSLFLIPSVRAAEMFFVSSDQKPAVGELFKADLFINTEEENINAMAGKVVFSGDLLELKEIRDGNSIVNLWIDRPMVGEPVSFSGITPGGYKGANGLLFSLIFRALKPGPVSIKVTEGQALLNDGKGTAAKLSARALSLQAVAESDGEQADYAITDKTPPESFVPEISRDNDIEGGKWFVVFATQDKESGVDHYEAQEKKNNKPDNNWQTVASPYVLQDQTLQSYVYIKAIDKAGNTTLAVVNPKKLPFSYAKFLIYGIILIVATIFGIRLWRKKRG